MNKHVKMAAPSVVNGINVDDVKALVAGIVEDPARAVTHWKVSTAWQGQARSRSRIDGVKIGGDYVRREFTLDVDEPLELGGANQFANPQEYLLAALNACMTFGYVTLCALNGIALESLEIETEGDIDLRGFLGIDPNVRAGYACLEYTVRIKGDGTKEQFARIHEAVMATSPNFYNVANAVTLKPTLVIG